ECDTLPMVERAQAMQNISTMRRNRKDIFNGQLTVGLDLGDRWSFYCVLDESGKVILEQKLPTTPEASRLETLTIKPRWRSTAARALVRHGSAFSCRHTQVVSFLALIVLRFTVNSGQHPSELLSEASSGTGSPDGNRTRSFCLERAAC